MSLRINLGTAFGGPVGNRPPKAYPDPNMTDGTLSLFDVTRADCNPNPAGVLAAGALFHDLVPGRADAVVVRPGGSLPITNLAGLTGLSWGNAVVAGGNADVLRVSGAAPWADNEALCWFVWCKQATGGDTTAYRPLWHRGANAGTNANGAAFAIDTGSLGNNLRGQVLPDGTGASVGPNAGAGQVLARNAVHLVAFSVVPGGDMTLYHDGVAVLQAGGAPAVIESNPAWYTWLGMIGGGAVYRWGVEAAVAAGRSAADCVAAEWSRFNGAFA